MTFTVTKSAKTILATIVAATIASTALITPASAIHPKGGGSISLNIVPTNPDDARALRTAFGIYSLINALENGSSIKQKGTNNRAGLRQNGGRNNGLIYQEGVGHSGQLRQNGYNNSYGIFQFGKNTRANVIQNGRGQTGATFMFGW
ncbi:MAG: curlin [Rhizobiaceae bacterium]|nr:curlin [Rhizobiaceae bacterium]